MSKVWFCRNCGYEVSGRGRCHVCKQRLEESPLPELEPGAEEDEVGYRLEDWADHTRGNLIVALISANVIHRFEEDELVIGAEDEEKVDDLVEQVAADAAAEEEEAEAALPPDELSGDVQQLLGAARRLVEDPTDMEADADTLESSSAVFLAESWSRLDDDSWAAVGRVTRRLLAALGADEALEEEIKLQAGILTKLLGPSFEPAGVAANGAGTRADDEEVAEAPAVEAEADEEPEADEEFEAGDEPEADEEQEEAEEAALPQAKEGRRWGRRRRKDKGAEVAEEEPAEAEPDQAASEVTDEPVAAAAKHVEAGEQSDDESDADGEVPEADEREGESVYELPDWLPEQRAHLSLMMDAAGITYVWDAGDLVVPLARDTEVEELFGQVEGVQMDEDDEARYRALEALFAAADRFLNDPDSETKAQEVVRAVEEADGPTPVGVDDGLWWSIRQQARTVAAAIERDASLDLIFAETKELRDELRPLM